jgi:hypothetical protein
MDVFLSYNADSPADRQAAEAVAARLRAEDHRPLSINLRTTFNEDVNKGLLSFPWSMEFFVVFISRQFEQSAWHHREIAAFLAYEGERALPGMIVPVMVESTASHWILNQYPPVANFQAQGEKGACEVLLNHLRGVPRPKPQVFVVMRLGDAELDDVYKLAIERAIKDAGFVPRRISEVEDSSNIPVQILDYIDNSKIIIADFTYQRRNCYFEAGYALGRGKEVIFTVNLEKRMAGANPDDEKLAFDIAGHRFIEWKEPRKLYDKLMERFVAIAEREKKPPKSPQDGTLTPAQFQVFRYLAPGSVAASDATAAAQQPPAAGPGAAPS